MLCSRNLLYFVFTFLISISTAIANDGIPRYKEGEVIVKFRPGMRSRSMMESMYDSVSVEKVRRFRGRFSQFEQLKLAEGTNVREAIRKIQENSAIEYAQPNFILRIPNTDLARNRRPRFDDTVPCLWPGFPPGCADAPVDRPAIGEKPAEIDPPQADPLLGKAWGIAKIGADQAWRATKGSQNIVVGVIDTGVDYNHEDLSFNMWRNPNPTHGDVVGWDFVHNDNLPFDDHMHGTHVSGTIGGVGGNGKGVSGVNQRVSIMALKFLSSEGYGDTATAILAIDYAIEHGARILNNSWGGGPDENNEALSDAVKRAEQAGVLFVAAAGNDNADIDENPMYPAAFKHSNMITVAATTPNDERAFFSNYGEKSVHLGAPGLDILSSIPGNSYREASGTSMACPHVVGAAALLWSMDPKMNYKEVKARLLESVDPNVSMQNTITKGRLNLARAVGTLIEDHGGGSPRDGRDSNDDDWGWENDDDWFNQD